jgi:hypothetical protein
MVGVGKHARTVTELAAVPSLLGPSLTSLHIFDYDMYMAACFELATFWFVWQPPGCAVRVDRNIPLSQPIGTAEKLKALFAYAERTDPNGDARRRHVREAWDNRRPGESIVFLHRKRKVPAPTA